MQFVDRTLLRLTDESERSALFTPAVGDALLAAAYVFDELHVGEVTAVSVRAVTLAPVVHPARSLTARAQDATAGTYWQVAADLPPLPTAAGHAVIEVDVTAATRGVVSEVTDVASTDLSDLTDLDALDARIVADDGGLPADPAALENRRYEELLVAVADRFPETEPADVRAALIGRGLTGLEPLRAQLSAPHAVSRLALTVVTDSTTPAAARSYRLKAIVHVAADLAAGLAAALTEISLARSALAAGVDPQPVPAGMSARLEYPALLLVPGEELDDDDLPLPAGPSPAGSAARRAARLTELTTRLRPTAVVPVAV